MRVELTGFRVKPGKSSRVDEWLSMLNARMDEVRQTLEREQMKLEIPIFALDESRRGQPWDAGYTLRNLRALATPESAETLQH